MFIYKKQCKVKKKRYIYVSYASNNSMLLWKHIGYPAQFSHQEGEKIGRCGLYHLGEARFFCRVNNSHIKL